MKFFKDMIDSAKMIWGYSINDYKNGNILTRNKYYIILSTVVMFISLFIGSLTYSSLAAHVAIGGFIGILLFGLLGLILEGIVDKNGNQCNE